jgi:hypothetical protein
MRQKVIPDGTFLASCNMWTMMHFPVEKQCTVNCTLWNLAVYVNHILELAVAGIYGVQVGEFG